MRNTGVIGAGRIGATLARLLVGAGDRVRLANASGPAGLAPLLGELGPAATAGTARDVVDEADLLVLMVPFGSAASLLPPLAEALAGKVLVDAMNDFSPDGRRRDPAGPGTSELVQALCPGARLVKSLNTMHYETLANGGRPGDDTPEKLAHYVAGDDEEAKDTVSDLLAELGFAVVDTGPLHAGGILQEPGGPVFNKPFTERQARAALGF